MFYRICPHCGCNLDPEEKCDCREQHEAEIEKREQEVMAMLITENNGQMRLAV